MAYEEYKVLLLAKQQDLLAQQNIAESLGFCCLISAVFIVRLASMSALAV